MQSLAMRRGINPYAGDLETVYIEAGHPLGDLDMGINYLCDTPTWIVLFEPFTFLRRKAGYWTWQALNMMALAGALFLLIRELRPPGADGWAVAALMVLYPPISLSILFGRGEMVLLLLFVLPLVAMKRRRDAALGTTLGIAALLRAYLLGMLGYLIACRRRRATAYGRRLRARRHADRRRSRNHPDRKFREYGNASARKALLDQLMGFLRHPYNLNLGGFVRFVVNTASALARGRPVRGLLSS